MNVLFVCSMARLRSKTAFYCLPLKSDYCGTEDDADRPVTKELMDWADKIVCMELSNRSKLRRKFKGYSHKMSVWSIPDEYHFMDRFLIKRLKDKAEKHLQQEIK